MMPKRTKKIIILHHCLLNQNARAKGAEKWKALDNSLIAALGKKNISIIQLPCPEIGFLGADRKAKDKKFYSRPKFKSICRKIAKELLLLIKAYQKKKYRILGIVGINSSPSCGVTSVYTGKNRKERGSGILVEAINKALKRAKIKLPYLNYSENLPT